MLGFRFLKTINFGSRRRRLLVISAATGFGLGTIATPGSHDAGVVRLGRAVATVFEICTTYQKQLYGSLMNKNSEEFHRLRSEVHRYGAEQLLKLCCTNKGVYIKVGQHIGALDYLLPSEYVETMRVLHSSAPRSSLSDVLAVIEEDFHKDASEIFESIDPEPLGTASLAQVHRAVLKDGTRVAVKVQHRTVKANAATDIRTMTALAKITAWMFPDFKFDRIVNESKRTIPEELDFACEGRNAEKATKLIEDRFPWLKIPRIYWEYSSSRVLTMEYHEGGQINDLNYLNKHNINLNDVSAKLGQLYSFMIFDSGFVHSDPHPGNILVRRAANKEETELVLLDHGLYATLSDGFRREYAKLWLAIMNGDEIRMKEHCEKLGAGDLYVLLSCMVSGRAWNTIVSGIGKNNYTAAEKDAVQASVPEMLPQISQVLQTVDREMLLVLRTNDLLRGIEHTLKPRSRMSGFVMTNYCVRLVYEEKQRTCTTPLAKFGVVLQKQFSFAKLTMYYVYLNVRNFDLQRIIESVFTNDICMF